MEPTKTIGHNIKFQKETKGIKQEILAKYLGISKGRMSQIENGDCRELTLNRLQTIASYIGVGFFDLFTPPRVILQMTYKSHEHQISLEE